MMLAGFAFGLLVMGDRRRRLPFMVARHPSPATARRALGPAGSAAAATSHARSGRKRRNRARVVDLLEY